MQIAIVSTDGKNVNAHFGKAERFLIYKAGPDGLTMLYERKVSPLSIGDKSHKFDPTRFEAIAKALEGCGQVYSTRIGDRPQQELEKLGVISVSYKGAIDAISVTD